MLKLDNNLLNELDLGGLPDDQKRAMLQHIYETLELRVGTNLANQMTDQQLEEFEKFIDEGGDANQSEALRWLETNLPNYKQVVNDVFEQLKIEIKQMAPQIMAASAQQPTAVPATNSAAAQSPQAPAAQPAPVDYQQPTPPQPQYQPPAPNYQQPQTPYTPPQPNQPGGYQPMPQGYQPAPSQQNQQPPQYPPQQAA